MSKNEKKRSYWEIATTIIDIILYIGIIVILVFWQLFPDVFSDFTIQSILISILVLFGSCWLSVIEKISKVKKLFQQIDATEIMKYDYLSNHIDDIAKKKTHIKDLKILDVSAEDFLHLFSSNNVTVDNCTLLVREYKNRDLGFSIKSNNTINDSINRWKKYEELGRIMNLSIVTYSNMPQSFFCIIDSKITLSGYIKDIPLREDPNVLMVDITSRKGHQLIQQHIKEFEFLLTLAKKNSTGRFDTGNVLAYQNVSDSGAKELLHLALKKATKVDVVGLACSEISDLSKEDYRTILLNNKGCIRILYLDPDGEPIKERERMERGQDITDYTFGSIVKYNESRVMKKVVDISKSSKNRDILECVQIFHYNFLPTINCIITDEYAFVHYYGMKNSGMDEPTFVINKSHDPDIYSYFQRTFNEHWALRDNVHQISNDEE